MNLSDQKHINSFIWQTPDVPISMLAMKDAEIKSYCPHPQGESQTPWETHHMWELNAWVENAFETRSKGTFMK